MPMATNEFDQNRHQSEAKSLQNPTNVPIDGQISRDLGKIQKTEQNLRKSQKTLRISSRTDRFSTLLHFIEKEARKTVFKTRIGS